MATIRAGSKTVFIVLDVQNGVMKTAHEGAAVVENCAVVLAKARAKGVPVIFVRHESDDLPNGSEAWQVVDELKPQSSDAFVGKTCNSAFEGTKLEELLAGFGATKIVLVGAATNWCLRATAYAALDRGYDMTLVSDAHTTESLELPGGKKVEAADMIIDLNIAMKWLRFDGKKNDVLSAAEIEF
jgi:nicotinamidase-related amidase